VSLPPGPRITPREVPALAHHYGVPPEVAPGAADLEVNGGRADGWVVTATDTLPARFTHDGGWPAGRFTVVGGLLLGHPTAPAWPPLINLGGSLIAGFLTTLTIPGGRAMAHVRWRLKPTGVYELRSELHFTPGRPRWTDAELDRAAKALRWLETLPRTGGPTATSDEAAFEEAVRLGMEWLNDHPGEHPKDFGRPQFAAKRCTGLEAANAWMTAKHFGIKRVQREIARRVRWPT
jgi:hypothetical protein